MSAVLVLFSLLLPLSAKADPNIRRTITTFVFDSVTYTLTGSTSGANGHVALTFAGTDGGVSSMDMDTLNLSVSDWEITPPGGDTSTYTGGPFTLSVDGPNLLTSINGVGYGTDGWNDGYLHANDVNSVMDTVNWTSPHMPASFTYNGSPYESCDNLGGTNLDYWWAKSYASDLPLYLDGNGHAATFDGSSLNIIDFGAYVMSNGNSGDVIFTLQSGAAGPNALTAVNQVSLKINGNEAVMEPPISSFTFNGETFSASAIEITPDAGGIEYLSFGGSAGDGAAGSFCVALGSWNIWSNNFSCVNFSYDNGANYGRPGTYHYDGGGTYDENGNWVDLPNSLTSVNGKPCYIDGDFAVPYTPVVNSFVYNEQTYTLTSGTLAANGDLISQYQTGTGDTAALDWQPNNNNKIVNLTITPSGGGTISYLGRGADFVRAGSSTLPNLLTKVNDTAYQADVIDGNISRPAFFGSGGDDLDVLGNIFSLGSWLNDSSHAGLTLSYSDCANSSSAATVSLTASRPLTNWLWSSATERGSATHPSMKLDSRNRLILYDPADPTTPAIILDPAGKSHIKPQGDLSMGEFTQEAQ